MPQAHSILHHKKIPSESPNTVLALCLSCWIEENMIVVDDSAAPARLIANAANECTILSYQDIKLQLQMTVFFFCRLRISMVSLLIRA